MQLFRTWFSLSVDVSRVTYAASGFGLMIVKYAVEAGLIWFYTGRFFAPHNFLNPLLSMRQEFFQPPAPDWLQWVLFVFTLPFLWIAISMSVRRAANAGAGALVGLLVLVPLVNYITMVLLCLLPTRLELDWVDKLVAPQVDHRMKSALWGIVAGLGIALVMVGIGVYALKDYGATLFLGTPILVGATSAFIYNRPYVRTLGSSLVVSQLAILMCGLAMLLFAFEGAICLAMLFPIAAVMGLLGGMIGYVVGAMTASRGVHLSLLLVVLPALAGAESLHRPTPVYEVITTVEIDAPPERVWPYVIGFSELPEPDPWYFKLGIAYPRRATIQGTGVGAVRRCEFSTGAFVEPVTVWDPPRRLAFDVESQPPPMHELSPYRHVHPPHLDGYLRCQRGEFRLIALPGGRTRLEGSTWYEFEMYPQDYWTLWSDACIHRIHQRVLRHIKNLSERDQPVSALQKM
jgi:hypothetical protein